MAAASVSTGTGASPGCRANRRATLRVAAWRDAPYFTDAERAALALAEAVTRSATGPTRCPTTIWDEAARHYDEPALAALILAIANINVWNRLNVATRQVAAGSVVSATRRLGLGRRRALEGQGSGEGRDALADLGEATRGQAVAGSDDAYRAHWPRIAQVIHEATRRMRRPGTPRRPTHSLAARVAAISRSRARRPVIVRSV